jgi:hypothetical protein
MPESVREQINGILARCQFGEPEPQPATPIEDGLRAFLVSLPSFGSAWHRCDITAVLIPSQDIPVLYSAALGRMGICDGRRMICVERIIIYLDPDSGRPMVAATSPCDYEEDI